MSSLGRDLEHNARLKLESEVESLRKRLIEEEARTNAAYRQATELLESRDALRKALEQARQERDTARSFVLAQQGLRPTEWGNEQELAARLAEAQAQAAAYRQALEQIALGNMGSVSAPRVAKQALAATPTQAGEN